MKEEENRYRSSKKGNKNLFFHFLKNKGQMTHLHSLALLVHSGGSLTFFLKMKLNKLIIFLIPLNKKI